MKFKLKRIDWYIIKQFLGTYVFAIALIISISVVFDINEKIDKFLESRCPLEGDHRGLLLELYPLLRQFVQSVVHIYRRDLFHVEASGSFGDHSDACQRYEFP